MADDKLTNSPPATVPPPEKPAAPTPHITYTHPDSAVMWLRWLVGIVVLITCGWGLIIFGAWWTGSWEKGALVGSLLSFFLLYNLEHELWLSRFMGLRLGPNSTPFKETLFFWFTGVPGLLWRSTEPIPEQQPAAAEKPRVTPPQMDSFREVVETIVFVVVLVLLLKSFAAEAFVIPTGSMAETLYGYQKIVKCPKCEYEFPVNCSSEVDPSEGRGKRDVYGCTCSNCMQAIRFANAPARFDEHAVTIPDPGWNSGDRVLVSKFQYDLLQRSPDRLDVVVFKYPGDSDFPRSGPNKNYVPMNYIKRLVGLSEETIAIHGGNLYRLPVEKAIKYPPSDGVNDADPRKAEGATKMLWRSANLHRNFPEAEDRFRQGQFEIIRKKPAQILSMKRIVYDNDHQAKDQTALPRWTGAPAWSVENVNGFKANPAADDPGLHWLRYRHLLRDKGGKPSLITDFMGYNSWDDGGAHRGNPGENWVGDLILECEVTIEKAQGDLVLELVKGVDKFRAQWDLGAGTCTLLRLENGDEQKLETKPSRLKPGNHKLRFANVDQRLTVWVDEDLVFGDGVTYQAPDKADRNNLNQRVLLELPTKNDLEPASVGVRGTSVKVEHLRLWRDTYYTVEPSQPDVHGANVLDPDAWAKDLTTLPVKTLYVQPGHYLCLGDNSPESSDGRSWGLVPERLLLGRALMVYYPLDRAGRIR